jgi:hypothetical protein
VNLDEIGGTARFELFMPAPANALARWFKYDPINGWYEFPVQYLAGKYILEIVDGGVGDADGVANGVIVDPIGMSDALALEEVPALDATESENTLDELLNSCFIMSSAHPSVWQDSHWRGAFRKGGAVVAGFALVLGLIGALNRKAGREKKIR